MAIKIGCCGFPVKRQEYASHLGLVEVQQTFYQPPQIAAVQRWRKDMPPQFEFSVKAWQLITHTPRSPTYRRLRRPLTPKEQQQAGSFRRTSLVQRAWEVTREVALALAARTILFQCPASFTPISDNLANLKNFFSETAEGSFLFAWEPRGDWPRTLVADLCQELGLIPVVDPFVTPPFPGSPAYFRLHGKGGYRYTYTEADFTELATVLSGYDEAYVLFNNLSMWDDARRLAAFVGKKEI
jgi:uncharacterized protein YecE (DUF72 family)